MQQHSINVGTRIHCEGEHGTVLYLGELQGVEGIWLGIEWDNPTRGKHSGCYKNITYFSTSVPNAGSFIKLSKAETGISCVDALLAKYGKTSDSTNTPAFISLPQITGQERQIEVIGMEKILGKQSNYTRLTDIVLSGMLVNGAGHENELHNLAPNIKSLDLRDNLISSWLDINDIAKQLPHLTTLVLSRNRLSITENDEACRNCYKSLKMLVLDRMDYCWNDILLCAYMWPFIEELRVLDNRITNLKQPPLPIFSSLKSLYLDNNAIGEWEEICKLGSLPKLEELYLDNTSLQSIKFPDTMPSEKTTLFPNLQILFLRKNNLKQWKDIAELNKLTSIKSLMLKNNPIFESFNLETSRQLVIAKIQSLEILNKTLIERSERRGAEVDYLKRYRSDWISSSGSANPCESKPSLDFLEEHPTYLLLMQQHGAAEESEIKVKSALLKDNLICVKIFSPLVPNKLPISRKLPAEMAVGKLKALVQRIFKISAHEITLTRIFKEDETQKTEMDNNLRQLSFYSLADEDKISVEW